MKILEEPLGKYAWAALMTGLSLLLFGYDFGLDPNLAQVLPYINKLADPSLYPGDIFLKSFSSFPSLYPAAAAFLGRFAGLGALHFAAYAAARFIFLSLVFELAECLTGSRKTAFAAALAAAVSVQVNILTMLGEDPLLKTSFFQSTLAGVIGTLSLLLFFRKKYIPAFAALGAMLFINGLPALYLAALYAFALKGAPDARAMRRGWAALGAVSLVWFAWLGTLHNRFGGPGPDYSAILKYWYPGHYFPSGWSGLKWFRLAVFLPLNLLLFYAGAENSAEKRELSAFMRAFYFLWAAAFILGELFPLPRLVNLQFFRSDAFFFLFGVIFAADFLRARFGEDGPGGWALGALILMSFMENGGAVYPLFALALLLAWRSGPAWAFRAAALAGSAFCARELLLLPAADHKKYTAALLLFGLGALAGKSYKASFKGWRAAPLALAAIIIPSLPLINYRFSSRSLSNYGAESASWLGLQKWARDNTPPAAVFLVPPDTYGFRVFSLRSPVVEWLDAGAMHWAPGFETEWKARIADLRAENPLSSGPDLGYSGIGADGFIRLARKYGASYAVRRTSEPLPFKELYANPYFTLYALPSTIRAPNFVK